MLSDHVIVGVHVTDRVQHASEVQRILTSFGCAIKTRLGLHDADREYCSPNGLLLLEFIGGESECDEMVAKLKALKGVDVQKMVFNHP